MNYIDRERTLTALQQMAYWDNSDEEEVIDIIYNLPTEDVMPITHGKWIIKNLEDLPFPMPLFNIEVIECSNCEKCQMDSQQVFKQQGYYNYCPNCGAKMDLESDD